MQRACQELAVTRPLQASTGGRSSVLFRKVEDSPKASGGQGTNPLVACCRKGSGRMIDTRRLRTLVWAMIAMIAIATSVAPHPASAAVQHRCVDASHIAHGSDKAHGHPETPGCCAMHCCPVMPGAAPGLPAIRIGLVPPVRADVEDPLALDRNIDPPPRSVGA